VTHLAGWGFSKAVKALAASFETRFTKYALDWWQPPGLVIWLTQ
jgi:hypothetical protein